MFDSETIKVSFYVIKLGYVKTHTLYQSLKKNLDNVFSLAGNSLRPILKTMAVVTLNTTGFKIKVIIETVFKQFAFKGGYLFAIYTFLVEYYLYKLF